MNCLVSNLKLLAQESSGNYKFSGQLYMTQGFISEFGDAAARIGVTVIKKIVLELVMVREVIIIRSLSIWVIVLGY